MGSENKNVPLRRTSSKQYDFTALISAYIDVRRGFFIHEDFENFYRDRLAALETAFGVQLSSKGKGVPPTRDLWMLFEATLKTFLVTHHPRSGFQEASLINHMLEQLGDDGKEVSRIERELVEVITKVHSLERQLLARLFVIMYGEHPEVFTSAYLKELGFDDSTEPDIMDYFEYL